MSLVAPTCSANAEVAGVFTSTLSAYFHSTVPVVALADLARRPGEEISITDPGVGSDENDETDYNHNAVSGYRASSDILIRINVKEAEKCGIVFWKSINGVYLTRGNDNGIIPSDYLEVLTIN